MSYVGISLIPVDGGGGSNNRKKLTVPVALFQFRPITILYTAGHLVNGKWKVDENCEIIIITISFLFLFFVARAFYE